VTEKYALYEISFQNALLYSRAVPIPGDESEKDDAPLYDESKDMNNPANFEDFGDEDEIEVKAQR